MSHLLHVFPLIRLHELTPITDAYQWNAHDHLEQTILKCFSSPVKLSPQIITVHNSVVHPPSEQH